MVEEAIRMRTLVYIHNILSGLLDIDSITAVGPDGGHLGRKLTSLVVDLRIVEEKPVLTIVG